MENNILSKEQLLNMTQYFDCIVIGGGHAGIEASLACARLNHKTLMICGALHRIGNMPCNPSIGGPAKGILVREIDALGGEMGKAADATALQFKMLNTSKGPAVWALRVQSDKIEYQKYMENVCTHEPNLNVYIALVDKLITEDNKILGVILEDETKIYAKRVIVTTGTYLSSCIMWGDVCKVAGPDGEDTNYGLSKSLKNIGFNLIRLKTGTPPRVKTNTIDFSKGIVEHGTPYSTPFSEYSDLSKLRKPSDQLPCYLIWTNSNTHSIILNHMKESSMYSGLITGVGPRYCPSIETKLVRFKDKERHQIFLEPESLSIDETYIQGFSTSMPHDIQDKMVKSLPGFENAVISKYSYAIEYDGIDPRQLYPTLESKLIKGLYFAGQVNGTSGYEEAACQGLMAGINAMCSLDNKEPLVLKRDEAYIGVLIDDIVTKGVIDPYRMLTSRAEYRLLLRHDNAHKRLIKYGYDIGLVSDVHYNLYIESRKRIDDEKARLATLHISPSSDINDYLSSISSSPLCEGLKAIDLMKRPEVHYMDIINMLHISDHLIEKEGLIVDIEVKYQGYIDKAYVEAKRVLKLESYLIPKDFDYSKVPNIASEAKEKLETIRPLTIAQASRISGVNPADISILLIYLQTRKEREANE